MTSFFLALSSGALLFIGFIVSVNPKRVNVLGNRWLAVFLFSLFLMLVNEPLFSLKLLEKYPHLLGIESLMIFAMGPSLYLCVAHYVSLDKKFKKLDLLHFIPTFLMWPLLIYSMFMSRTEKLAIINGEEIQTELQSDPLTIVLILQIVVYLIISYSKLQKHQNNIQIFVSDTSAVNLNWLKNAIIAISLMLVFWIIEMKFYDSQNVGDIASLGHCIGVFAVGYYALKQEEIFPYKATEIQEIKEILLETPVDQKTQRINNDELEKLKSKVSHLMEVDKLYLDETLSLPKLAESVETSVHNLSYILNEGFNENFFQFVNNYRVEEAKKLLNSEKIQQLSMVGIAFESGFSSKTTFNTTFKRITGISPSEFVSQKEKQKISV